MDQVAHLDGTNGDMWRHLGLMVDERPNTHNGFDYVQLILRCLSVGSAKY